MTYFGKPRLGTCEADKKNGKRMAKPIRGYWYMIIIKDLQAITLSLIVKWWI